MKKKTLLTILIPVLLIGVIVAMFVLHDNTHKKELYDLAVQADQNGQIEEAYTQFLALGNYRDSASKAKGLLVQDSLLPYRIAQKGDTIVFGHWEQDGNDRNGLEPIEWLVLDKVDGQLLLLSSACLMGKAYNTESFVPVTWETCSLRQWLHEVFLTEAFNEEEQAWIPTVTNENPDHSMVETPGGKDTKDRVFLLCERDTVIYLKDDVDRETIGKATATQAAINGGLQVNEEGMASWWLRSPGMYEYIAQFVDQDGVPYTNGASTDIDYLCGVRPVLWLNVEGDQP